MFNGPLSEPEVLADVSRSAAEHGLDFSLLHPEAVSAQVRSRAHDCGISVAEYLGTLRGARLEIETLLRAIVNTRGLFYQDPDGWEYLEHHLRKQWRDVSSEVQIRAWVPNCGSGQDAYTLAMVLAQALGNPEGLARRVQIIATDLDEYALDRARLGRYPVSTLSNLEEAWKKQYFDVDRGMATVHPILRDCLVFARHDLAVDPGLSRMHIVVCRDVLRYYTPEYRYSQVGSLHAGLEPGGVLFLGADDDLTSLQAIFRCESRSRGIFTRPGSPGGVAIQKRQILSRYRPEGVHLVEAWARASLSLGLVVDSEDRVVEVLGRLEDSPWVSTAAFDGRVGTLLNAELVSPVRDALARARRVTGTAGRWFQGRPPCLIRATAFETPRGPMVGLAILDESAGQLATEPLEPSPVDTLTGLLTRSGFLHEISEFLQDGSPTCAVMWIDLDHFSEVNDIHGHDFGDAVLCVIADRLRDVCGRRGYVGRLGSDQFGVVVTDVADSSQLMDIAESVRMELRKPVNLLPNPIRLTASIGVVLTQDAEEPARAVLAAADRAMYVAKESGGDRIQFSTVTHDDLARRRFQLRQQLADALLTDRLHLNYQPIFRVRDASLWGVEALLRWQHQGKVLPAGAFIDAAMQTGQIREIGARVVDLLAADWPRLEAVLPESALICMNMSVPEIEDRDLLDRLQSRLDSDRLARLVVEVTESAILGDEREAVTALEVLRSRGVRISLDDFGTGHSNLATLSQVAPDALKADRTFLDMAVRGQGQKSELLQTVRAIAGVFEADAVAEGVSSRAHLEAAIQAGFDLVQGFDIAMPSPVEGLSVTWT